MVPVINVLVTGAAGRVGFPLLYQLVNGDVFGLHQPIVLKLLELKSQLNKLTGIAMELEDCAMDNLKEVIPTTDPVKAFLNVDVAFLIASKPRPNLEPREQMAMTLEISKSHGVALNMFAKKTVKVVVIGHPSNTNAMICSRYAPTIPARNISSMSRLEENRAKSQIAATLSMTTNRVHNTIIWGNSSRTHFPDVSHATVEYPDQLRKEIGVFEAIKDDKWLRNEFICLLQSRSVGSVGMMTVSSPGLASAQAVVEHMRDWWHGTPPLTWVSMGVVSDGSYGVPQGTWCSFPVFIQDREWKIVKGLHIDAVCEAKLKKTIKELVDEHQEAIMLCDELWGPPEPTLPQADINRILAAMQSQEQTAEAKWDA